MNKAESAAQMMQLILLLIDGLRNKNRNFNCGLVSPFQVKLTWTDDLFAY